MSLALVAHAQVQPTQEPKYLSCAPVLSTEQAPPQAAPQPLNAEIPPGKSQRADSHDYLVGTGLWKVTIRMVVTSSKVRMSTVFQKRPNLKTANFQMYGMSASQTINELPYNPLKPLHVTLSSAKGELPAVALDCTVRDGVPAPAVVSDASLKAAQPAAATTQGDKPQDPQSKKPGH
jgi:hypothetical protein